MISQKEFTEIVLSFPGTEQNAHFDRIGFKVSGKRMFATYLAKDDTANIFLTPREQSHFCKMDTINIFPVPNKWGEKGATTFRLDQVSKQLILEALLSAFTDLLPPKK